MLLWAWVSFLLLPLQGGARERVVTLLVAREALTGVVANHPTAATPNHPKDVGGLCGVGARSGLCHRNTSWG